MKSFVLSSITLMSPFIALCADGVQASLEGEPVIPNCLKGKVHELAIKPFVFTQLVEAYEHRVNLGLLSVGYERIMKDSIYTGIDAKMTTYLSSFHQKGDKYDYFVNGELRLGYNTVLTDNDLLIPYLGTGFSFFSVQKKDGNVRNWTYGTAGVKYLHQFGETFEMGLHIKAYLGISRQKQTLSAKEVMVPQTPITGAGEAVPKINGELSVAEIKAKVEETVVKTIPAETKYARSTKWITEIGMPFIWHFGAEKNWECQFEPYYSQIPNVKLTHLIGTRLSFGYRF